MDSSTRREKQKPTGMERILTSPSSLLDKIGLSMDPTAFGLPDLLQEGLSEEEQDERLKQCVEKHLYIHKDGRRIQIILIPQMLEFISDLFFERTQQAILWKPRGGGGSLCASVLIWLSMVYRQKSFIDMAGSGEQAKRVYSYVSRFWFCIPNMAESLLLKDPLLSETILKNGVTLTCIPASEKAARGRHSPGFVADESCSEDPRVGKVLEAGLQGALSEPDFMIVLLSTFHVPIGFFQQAWDHGEERGYRRYKWNVFDTMQQCAEGMDTATEEDPNALCFCKTKCPLTEQEAVKDESGALVGHEYRGCIGKARDSKGHLPRENVLKAKALNAGGETWRVEHECERPSTSGMIYDPEKLNLALREDVKPVEGRARRSVGVDWGRHCFVVMAERATTHITVARGKLLINRRLEDVVSYLRGLREEVGDFVCFVDSENRYGAIELSTAGFETVPVSFAKHKESGIENLSRLFQHERIRIRDRGDLSILGRQLMTYHRDELGKPVKRDDHGPDALLCACLHFPFQSEFEGVITYQAGSDGREGSITEAMLQGCVEELGEKHEKWSGYFPPTENGASMGVAVGSWYYVVISSIPEGKENFPRKALHIGKYRTLEEVTALLKEYGVKICCIAARPEILKAREWQDQNYRRCPILRVEYIDNGLGDIGEDWDECVLSVDKTTSLDQSYEELAGGKFKLPPNAAELASGDFIAQLKASCRVLDVSGKEPVYRWESRNLSDHFRHAHNLDRIASLYWSPLFEFDQLEGDPSWEFEGALDAWNAGAMQRDWEDAGWWR